MDNTERFNEIYGCIKRKDAVTLYLNLEDNGFFTAPASAKYHGAYPGGLLEHSLHVYDRLAAMPEVEEYSEETIAIVALLHDICKMKSYKLEKRKQKQPDGTWKEVDAYGYTNDFPIGHGEKSVIMIMRYMHLNDEEIMAIRWHMGGFDHAVKGGSYDMNNAYAACKLAAMLHIADMQATYLDEREESHDK